MINKTIKPTKFITIGMLLLVVIVGVFYFYHNDPSAGDAVFLRCPSHLIFGIYCPGCGTQRALHHLLHLEIREALRYNALFVLAAPFVIYGIAIKTYNFIFDAKKTTRIPTNRMVWIGLLLLVLLFGIMRNVSVYPFTLLSP